jgi:hypothetical protein
VAVGAAAVEVEVEVEVEAHCRGHRLSDIHRPVVSPSYHGIEMKWLMTRIMTVYATSTSTC